MSRIEPDDLWKVYAIVQPPIGGKPEDHLEVSFYIDPTRLKDLAMWKQLSRCVGLAFYRAFSGDTRGEELVKEFEAL